MTRFPLIFCLLVLLPSVASAKRAAPATVEPVIHEGIRYVAPNDDGRRGYIQAWDIKTNKKLWELTIFTNRIDPTLEKDVQWIFIFFFRSDECVQVSGIPFRDGTSRLNELRFSKVEKQPFIFGRYDLVTRVRLLSYRAESRHR
jgi:hypothetical protein